MSNPHSLLVTAIGFGESSNTATTPWSVYVTQNGIPALQGGTYPDENPDAELLVGNLNMEEATTTAKRLQSIMLKFGISCEIEELGDG